MSQPTHETSVLKQRDETAPPRFVEANGTQFAYRRFGRGEGIPLLFCQHFTGTMDNWDPIITNTLTQRREVILFDNRGIESSAGQTPDSVQAMATDALAFVDALGLKQIDLLGFSPGGMVAQQMVTRRWLGTSAGAAPMYVSGKQSNERPPSAVPEEAAMAIVEGVSETPRAAMRKRWIAS
jgi:pimeloyl-ACP methyl ester carboxylesterase